MIDKVVFRFLLVTLMSLILAFVVHWYSSLSVGFKYDLYQLIFPYVLNYIMAFVIFLLIVKVQKINTDIVGYVFLFGSMFKFLVYFTTINPVLKTDGVLEKAKFFFFFIPYTICLVLEVLYLIKILNSQSKDEKSDHELK
jgi:hypothetical protein